MLAPGLMISACALLLLGMNNKYSLVVNRMRLLNEEKRRFAAKAAEREFTFQEEVRLKSIAVQLDKLYVRVELVKNAVICYVLAIALFVITSFLIGMGFFFSNFFLQSGILIFFILGMVTLFAGVVFAGLETVRGYEIVSYELKADE